MTKIMDKVPLTWTSECTMMSTRKDLGPDHIQDKGRGCAGERGEAKESLWPRNQNTGYLKNIRLLRRLSLCIRPKKIYMLASLTLIKGSLQKIDIRKRFHAGYGIRTRELLRDRIISPAPLASLANPAQNSATHSEFHRL
jgi:hypothetical protein